MKKLFIGLIIGLIAGIIAGYFIAGFVSKPSRDFTGGGGFPVSEEIKDETVSFFESNPDYDEIESYCQENPMNCRYYCTEVNQNHEICSEISIQMPRR